MSQPVTLDPPVSAGALAQYREGRRLLDARDLHGALRCFQAALQQAGEHPGILEQLAIVAGEGGDLAAAERILRRVAQLRPTVAVAARLAIVVYKLQRYADAVPLFEAVLPHIQFNPDLADAYSLSLEAIGRVDAAIELREKIYRQAPAVQHATNLAVMLERHGRHERLAALLPTLLARFPGNLDVLGLAAVHALGSGDYPRGFALLRQRIALEGDGSLDPRLLACPLWDGQRFDGTLLLTMEPHLGEEIQVSSLLVDLARTGQPAVVEIDGRLLPLFRRAWPTLAFVARGSGELGARTAPGGVFRRARAIDLAQFFDRRCVLPAPKAWLTPPGELVRRKRAEYQARWPGRKLVGISWRSARLQQGVDRKSIPLASLPATLALADVAFIDLQYGDFRADCDALGGSGPAAPWRDPEINPTTDMDALAGQLCALDALVTVSNTTAHLAGALGVPTLVLLPKHYPVLWHWGYTGEQTTWYRSVQLLRNPEEQGFAALDRELAGRLSRLA